MPSKNSTKHNLEYFMDLNQSEKYAITESYVVGVLRRVIPGDYRRLCDLRCEGLQKAGIDLMMAGVIPPTNIVADLMHGGKNARLTKTKLQENPDTWQLALVSRQANSAAELQAAVFTTNPHGVMAKLFDLFALKDPAFVMASGEGHFIVINGNTLKTIARRTDEQ